MVHEESTSWHRERVPSRQATGAFVNTRRVRDEKLGAGSMPALAKGMICWIFAPSRQAAIDSRA